jgi:hypothetical protein
VSHLSMGRSNHLFLSWEGEIRNQDPEGIRKSTSKVTNYEFLICEKRIWIVESRES